MGYEGGGGGVGPTGPTGAAGAAGATGPTGPAGSANISGTLNTLVKYTPDGTTGGNSVATDDGTTFLIPETTIVRMNDIRAVVTTALRLLNATASDVTNTVQLAGSLIFEGHVRVSGSDKTFRISMRALPKTSGNHDILFEHDDGTSTLSTAFRYTTATASQVITALESSGFSCTQGSTGYVFDSDNSGMNRGGSGDLQFLARSTSLAMLLRSPTSTSGQASFRMYANGGTRGAAEALLEVGDVAAGFTLRWRVMGDGMAEGPRWHTDATVKTGTFSAVAHTAYMVDLSGVSTANVPAASAANIGHQIQFMQTVGGASTFTVTPASGTIEGVASITTTGTAVIAAATPGIAVTIQSCGVGTGSPGWKVV